MPLIKCPDCGKNISSRADKCPFCGCPAEFFEEQESIDARENLHVESLEVSEVHTNPNNSMIESNDKDVLSEEIREFDICGYKVKFSADIAEFAQLYGTYQRAADFARDEMLRLYEEAGGIEKALRILPDKANTCIFGIINEGIKSLYEHGVNITLEQFYNKYNYSYTMDYSYYYDDVLDEYSDIIGERNQLEAYREAQKASRGRWSGGGFGLKGAIKGAITASALNMGSDFLYSFGDSAKEREDDQQIRAKLKSLYRSSRGKLCYSVRTCIMDVFYAMIEEIEDHHIMKKTYQLDKDKAETLYETTLKYEKENNKIMANMATCICYYPGERKYYDIFKDNIITGESDIEPFLKFWNIEYLLDDLLSTRDKRMALDMIFQGDEGNSFDFNDFSAKNVCEFAKRLILYCRDNGTNAKKYLEVGGDCAEKCRNYCDKIVRNYKNWDYGILQWIPQNATFNEYWEDVKSLDELLGIGFCRIFSEIPDVTSNQKLSETLINNDDWVLLGYDSSLLENYGKGFLVSGKYTIDLKSRNKVENKKISQLNVIAQSNGSYALYLEDGKEQIEFKYQELIDEASIIFLKLFLEMIYIRFCENKILREELMGQVVDLNDEGYKIPNYVLGYYPANNQDNESDEKIYRYLNMVKDKHSIEELEEINLFRRYFKRLHTSGCRGYVCEIDKEKGLDDIKDEYVLYMNNDSGLAVTDQAVHIDKQRICFAEVKEFVYIAKNELYSHIVIIMKDGSNQLLKIKYNDYKKASDKDRNIKEILLEINIILEEIRHPGNLYYLKEDVLYCLKCRSFDVDRRMMSTRCRKCGKNDSVYTGLWTNKCNAILNCRSRIHASYLSSAEEEKLLYEENRIYEHILKMKESGGNESDSLESVFPKAHEPEFMYCAFCGQKIERSAVFCNFCGEKNPYLIADENVQAETVQVNKEE